MSQFVHIAARTDVDTLLNHPEKVMQIFSIKIFQRRQQLLDKMCNQRVSYEHGGATHTGMVERIDGQFVIVRENKEKYKVPLNKIIC